MAVLSVATEFEYPAHMVWACAAAADRINGGYRKDSTWDYDSHAPGELVGELVENPNNKTLVLRWLDQWRHNLLRKDTVTDRDAEDGAAAQRFGKVKCCCCWMTKAMNIYVLVLMLHTRPL